jgi:endonuclease/exonuclease/phosphatase family metal-dependent hydrolase
MTMGTPILAFASINIERSKHIPRVVTFLRAHAPEVVCLQELVPEDIAPLCQQLGYAHHFYIPMCRFPESSGPRTVGVGILSRHAFVSTEAVCYGGGGSGVDVLDRTSEEARFRTNRYSVALVGIRLGAETFNIATTHFPWTDNARTGDFQRTACDALLRLLQDRSLVLAGDFNAPRGKEIFTRLAAQWADHIPPTQTTSIDPVLHRAGPLQLMVDGVFSTDDYGVSGVTLHQGVSDHCAITAMVGKRVRRGRVGAMGSGPYAPSPTEGGSRS